MLGVAEEAHHDSIHELTASYAQGNDPWGKNPTVFNGGEYAESVDPVIAGLFRLQRLYWEEGFRIFNAMYMPREGVILTLCQKKKAP